MGKTPGALDKLYSMLHEADTLGLSRSARLKLIGIIGSLETEELERFRSTVRADERHERQEERQPGPPSRRPWAEYR